MGSSAGMGLRQKTRDLVRDQIATTALELFDERGFDRTTVDDIAAAVGISPRSFFRYFAAKEDVVLGDPMVYGEPVRARLVETIDQLPLWAALRAAFDPIVATVDADPAGALRATRVMISTPALRARNTEKHLAWMTVLAPIVAGPLRGADADRDFRSRAITLCALTCLDVTSAEWVRLDGAISNGRLLDDAFVMLKPALLTD